MKIRVNLANEQNTESYLVDTENIMDRDLKDALEFSAKNPGLGSHQVFGSYKVIHGDILQDGYAMNEELQRVAEEDDVVNVSVSTDI